MPYQPIENYAVIGDLHTVALVGMDGSIDFMAFPFFDSPTIFAAILDDQRGGRFRLAPVLEQARQKQLYLPDSNVLLSRFLAREGVAEISDFMPIEPVAGRQHHALVRRAKTVRGDFRYRMVCRPRFDYARAPHRVETRPGEVLFITEQPAPMALRLRLDVPFRIENGDVVAEFHRAAGQTASFILEQVIPERDSPSAHPDYVAEQFKATVNFWRRWIGRCAYRGRWREVVNRSALMLKLLTSAPHGSLVAAPTFGLPEAIGGRRNWDYRYTWIRDASFTLYALIRLGFTDETHAFMGWIQQRCKAAADGEGLQIIYGIDGRRDLTEVELQHLDGYRGSRPVRIGNGAWNQLQLDIYGELMDSVYLYNKYGQPIDYDLWVSLVRLIHWVCDNWRRPDQGIWEVRGGAHAFLYSRLMCWVALDRAVRLALKRSFPAPLEKWIAVRDEIYLEIMTHYWNPERHAFVQTRGGSAMDASTLLMPMVKFISPTDPRWLSTLRCIERDLVDDSLVFRYRLNEGVADGFLSGEGTFTMCSFWYVECLSRSGDIEKARLVLEKALGYANHVGLYAEELGPRGEHLGNYPQAFTHLGLISAAFDLNRRLDRAGQAG